MNKLWVRLSLAFLLVTWLAIAAVAAIVRNATENSFRDYVGQQTAVQISDDVIERLQTHFQTTGGWDGAAGLLPGQGTGRGRGGQGSQFLLVDIDGRVAVSTDSSLVGTHWDESSRDDAIPLMSAGVQVGWLAQLRPGPNALGEAESRFLEETTRWLMAATVGAGLLAVLFGGVLAWTLTAPLRTLTAAVRGFRSGMLGHQVRESGTQEMRDLARAFNTLSRDLSEGEQLRQRMAADIAHELRTPVSVLRGHLEAMLDGVFPLDDEHLAVAYEQTLHLARLVSDLRLLTQAESGSLPLERTTTDPGKLVIQAVDRFAPLALDAGISLTQDIEPGLPSVFVDTDRMQQVFGNLLSNALRHTPENGTIVFRAAAEGSNVRFTVSNSGPGLTEEQARHVFDRFWRAEESRERDRGGSGLGLAIARELVTLHQGKISVRGDEERTTFVLDLPAA